jgi:hypothetical protein
VLAALTIEDRLALATLKMADATFKAYSGPGYTHMHGGGLLVPNDYRGLASLLIEARTCVRPLQEHRTDEAGGYDAPGRAAPLHIAGLSGATGTSLTPPRYTGGAMSVHELDSAATEERNSLSHQSLGERRLRDFQEHRTCAREQPVLATSIETSPDNAVHTVLYPHGQSTKNYSRIYRGIERFTIRL